MRLALGFALALASAGWAGDASLVDGETLHAVEFDGATPATVVFRQGAEVRELPATRVVSVRLAEGLPTRSSDAFNLYLANGDRLRGSVRGAGTWLAIDSDSLQDVRVPLAAVRAVRFGHLVGALQARYNEAFEREVERGRDVVLVERGETPFPIAARVLEVGRDNIAVRLGEQRRELETRKVFGFVLSNEVPDEPPGPLRVRLHLGGGARITLPLERVTSKAVESPLGRVLRWADVETGEGTERRLYLREIEFLGEHYAHLSAFDPIDVEQTPLFGSPVAWRRDGMVLGGPLRLGGKTYAVGLGVQARSRLEYVLGARWSRFFVRCGVDDAASPEGEALFRVLGDGKVLGEAVHRRGEPARLLRLDVSGIDRLVLEALPGEEYTSDLCDWAEARVYNAPPVQDRREGGE